MTIYKCDGCGMPVEPGTGYVHIAHGGKYWQVHHKGCAGDLTDHYCVGVGASWVDVYTAHRTLASTLGRKQTVAA